MDAVDRDRLAEHLDRGFAELQLRDIQQSDASDVRMGTFIQIAAFIDALALAYSGTSKNDYAKKWRKFMRRYFPPAYTPEVADAYNSFRCLLLHNFSSTGDLGFTHNQPERHLRTENGRLILNRGSFVTDTVAAFERFRDDALADHAIGSRVLAWLDKRPPIGFWKPETERAQQDPPPVTLPTLSAAPAAPLAPTESLSASVAGSHTTLVGWHREPDRPRAKKKQD